MKKRRWTLAFVLAVVFSLGLCSGLAAFADATAETPSVAIGQLTYDTDARLANMSPVEGSTQKAVRLVNEFAPAVRCADADLSVIGRENGALTFWWYIPNGAALAAWKSGGGRKFR